MRNMDKLLILLVILLISCVKENNLTEPIFDSNIDNSFNGYWIKFDTLEYMDGRPEILISGFKILKDGNVLHLAVEFSSGKIASYEKSWTPPLRIIKAQYGEIIFETSYFIYPDGQTYHSGYTYIGNYYFDSGILIIENDSTRLPLAGKFYHFEKISVVTEPVKTNLFCIMGQDTFKNANVWPYPSAYCYKYPPDSLANIQITAIDENFHMIQFSIKSHGVGTYVLGQYQDGYGRYFNGAGLLINTEDENNGILEITKFDIINNRCEGNFNFYIGDLNFQSGLFNVPLYHIK